MNQMIQARQGYRDIEAAHARVGAALINVPVDGACNVAMDAKHMLPVGFPRACIERCKREEVPTRVCGSFAPFFLYVSPTCGSRLSIVGIIFCRWNALGNSNPVPADLFSSPLTAENPTWDGSIVIPANGDATLIIVNDDEDESVRLRAALVGVVCDPC